MGLLTELTLSDNRQAETTEPNVGAKENHTDCDTQLHTYQIFFEFGILKQATKSSDVLLLRNTGIME